MALCARGCGAALRMGRAANPPASGIICLSPDYDVDFPSQARCPLVALSPIAEDPPAIPMVGSDGRPPPTLSGWPTVTEWTSVLAEFAQAPPPRDAAAFASTDPPTPPELGYLSATYASTSNRSFPGHALEFFPQRIPMEVIRLLNPLLTDPSFDRHRTFPSPPSYTLPGMAPALRTWEKSLDAAVCAHLRRLGEAPLFAFFASLSRDPALGAKDLRGFPVVEGARQIVVSPPDAWVRASLSAFMRFQAAGVDQGATLSISLLDVLSRPPQFLDNRGLPMDPRPLLILFGFLAELAAATANRQASAASYGVLTTAQGFLLSAAHAAFRAWVAVQGQKSPLNRRSDDRAAAPAPARSAPQRGRPANRPPPAPS